MKKFIFVFTIIIMAVKLAAQDKVDINNNFALGISISPVLLYSFDHSNVRSVRNKYNFQTGIGVYYYKNLASGRIGLSSGVNFGTKRFETNYHDGGALTKASHYYSFIIIPALINYSIKIRNNYIGIGIGLNFNYFISAKYEPEYNDGSGEYDFPGELSFDPFKELVVYVVIEPTILKSNYTIGIQPFFLCNLNQPIFFRESFYNLGKTAVGLNLILKKHFKPLKLK